MKRRLATSLKAKLKGIWDNYEGKRYNRALQPGEGLLEIGKMLWHGFNGEFNIPRSYRSEVRRVIA